MELVLISILVIGAAMAIMAVGVIFSNRCLRGSCGGPDVLGPDGELLTCPTCPHRGRQGSEERIPGTPAS